MEVDGRLVRRNRKHLRRLGEITQDVDGATTGDQDLFPETIDGERVSKRGRAIRKKRDGKYCYYT